MPPNLLDLPYDLKVLILKELLCHHEEVYIYPDFHHAGAPQSLVRTFNVSLHTAILRTCRTLYNDGIYVLYHLNNFGIDDDSLGRDEYKTFVRWTREIGGLNANTLSSLSIHLTTHHFRKDPFFTNNSVRRKVIARYQLMLARRLQSHLKALAFLATPESRLRHLTIGFDVSWQNGVTALLIEVEIMRLLATFKGLETFGLIGCLPYIFAQYLNGKLRQPI